MEAVRVRIAGLSIRRMIGAQQRLYVLQFGNMTLSLMSGNRHAQAQRDNQGISGYLSYTCNVCGFSCWARVMELSREDPSCSRCGSTVRMRAIVYVLSTVLFGDSLALPDFPKNKAIIGLGMSDWDQYAAPLEEKLGYRNTYFDRDPKLDITDIPPELESTCDFLISSEVLEHVCPPVSVAFQNAYRLLRPNGVFVVTVPYVKYGETREHFPNLHHYEIKDCAGKLVLKNVTEDGREEHFSDLVFHGGQGATLEMRVFSETSLKTALDMVGFRDIKIWDAPIYEHGIVWHQNQSLPITARK